MKNFLFLFLVLILTAFTFTGPDTVVDEGTYVNETALVSFTFESGNTDTFVLQVDELSPELLKGVQEDMQTLANSTGLTFTFSMEIGGDTHTTTVKHWTTSLDKPVIPSEIGEKHIRTYATFLSDKANWDVLEEGMVNGESVKANHRELACQTTGLWCYGCSGAPVGACHYTTYCDGHKICSTIAASVCSALGGCSTEE